MMPLAGPWCLAVLPISAPTSRLSAGSLRRSAILARTIGQTVPEPDFNCLMVRSRLQHHVRLRDSIDERACIDLLRAHRVVVSVETGEPVEHFFLSGISRDGKGHGSSSRLLSPACVPFKDQRLINFAGYDWRQCSARSIGTVLPRSASLPWSSGLSF